MSHHKNKYQLYARLRRMVANLRELTNECPQGDVVGVNRAIEIVLEELEPIFEDEEIDDVHISDLPVLREELRMASEGSLASGQEEVKAEV